jgi:hypothetical protein
MAKIPTAVDIVREMRKEQNKADAAASAPPPATKLKPSEAQPGQPDVGLRLVGRKAPTIVISNLSNVVAREVKWCVALWNMDLPDRADPLPIPVSTVDWLRPHSESGPLSLFANQMVSSLVKAGDHLIGSAVVICPNCLRGHTYVVNIVFGSGGWFGEDRSDASGTLIVPQDFRKESREAFFAQLSTLVPENKRIGIAEYSLKPAKPIF